MLTEFTILIAPQINVDTSEHSITVTIIFVFIDFIPISPSVQIPPVVSILPYSTLFSIKYILFRYVFVDFKIICYFFIHFIEHIFVFLLHVF